MQKIFTIPFYIPGALAANHYCEFKLPFDAQLIAVSVCNSTANAGKIDVGILKRQEIVARLAEKHGAALVQFQRIFDEAAKRAPADYWIWDGVHPTYAGHQILADAWELAVREAGAQPKR